MNEIPKIVFSKTLERADWPEARIARGDLSEQIWRLKQNPEVGQPWRQMCVHERPS